MNKLSKIICIPEEVNIKSIIADNIILYNQNFKHKNIEVKYSTSIDKKVLVDVRMFDVIIKNILDNSIKYISKNGQLSISVESNLTYARIHFFFGEITDNELEYIIEQDVFNLSNNIDLQTYIGFQVCEEFISKNNGRFIIESNKELGTTVIIELPLGNERLKERSQNNKIKAIKTKDAKEGKPLKRILIVEDNDDLRNILEHKFSQSFITYTAENGEKGVEIATQKIPDIIITDIDMPVMNGKVMCNIIKSNAITSHIPIIIISALDSVFDQIEGLNLGIDDYILKPFQLDILSMKVLSLLKNREEYSKFIKNQYVKNPTGEFPETSEEIFVKKVVGIIEDNVNSGDLNVAFLASKIGYSQAKLYRKFISSFNQKPSEIIKKYKLKKARKMLETKQYKVADVAYECGFNDAHYFSRCFYDEYKFIPSDIINGNVLDPVV